ncbi:MAG: ThiF family adenylyltransferase [Candidatus Marinimicrobia bacterium]|nr:ThiF family adenylyltransferase [Candidatus Neomarinimicrobiota bacterium]
MSSIGQEFSYFAFKKGRPKIDSAQESLAALNPHVRTIGHAEKVSPENVWELIAPYDIIVDASDNFPTRYLLNDACVQAAKPLVFGAVLMFSGQVTVFTQQPGCGCYRCLYREAPQPQFAPSCAEAGIFGAITGIIGSLQAAETLKLILNSAGHMVGPVLENRLMIYDGNESSFQTVELSKDDGCPVCSDPDFDFRGVTYADSCAVGSPVSLKPPAK